MIISYPSSVVINQSPKDLPFISNLGEFLHLLVEPLHISLLVNILNLFDPPVKEIHCGIPSGVSVESICGFIQVGVGDSGSHVFSENVLGIDHWPIRLL